jgi:hypothetical protein
MEVILPELNVFIQQFCIKNKTGRKALPGLSLDTSLYPDLDLSDLDMDLFLGEFVEKFQIDYSGFHWGKYGYPKGYALMDILKCFGYNKPWVRRIADLVYPPKFFVRNLQQAIVTGKLE